MIVNTVVSVPVKVNQIQTIHYDAAAMGEIIQALATN